MSVTAAATPDSSFTRYTVASSDVLSDMRLNVSEEGSEKVIWYKERFLGDDEIIEHIVDNATSTIEWTIHRPKRGWYIRLRAPTFPPGTFISLNPLPPSSPYHTEAALTFACRTNLPPSYNDAASSSKASIDSEATLSDSRRDSATHSYPPTPPAQGPVVMVHPPSPRSVNAKLAELPQKRLAQVVTPFLLTPHSNPHIPHQQQLSMFARVMSALKNSAPSHSTSFTLSPIPQLPPTRDESASTPTPTALLTYHDQTPVWTVGSMHGLIELNTRLAQDLGVSTSFYVAVALTYLEFLTERDSYIAATAD